MQTRKAPVSLSIIPSYVALKKQNKTKTTAKAILLYASKPAPLHPLKIKTQNRLK